MFTAKSIDSNPVSAERFYGTGFESPKGRRLMHKCESGLSRNRDNQCRISGAGESEFCITDN